MITARSNSNSDFNPLPPLRAFTLLWLLLTLVFSLSLVGQDQSVSRITQPERIRLWIQMVYATIAALYLQIPRLELRLGHAYVPIVLLVLSVGAIATLFVPSDGGGRGSTPVLFQYISSTIRSHVIWVVATTIIGWLYTAQLAVTYSIVMGAVVSASIVQVDNLRAGAIRGHIITTLFLMVGFGLVGYLVARFSAIEKQRREELATSNRQLASYASTLEQLTIGRERNRLARELHDTLAHTLSGLAVQMETIRRYWDVDNATAKQLFEQAATLTREGLDETRRALTALRASPLEELGLTMALEELAKSAESRAGLQLKLMLPQQQLSLAPNIEQTIYRIAQEAINNVVRHAQAETLTVQLQSNNPTELVIADDGKGFSATTHSSSKHFGLVGMHERATLIGGTLTIHSQPNLGTTVKLTL